jgi:hypothetical protein
VLCPPPRATHFALDEQRAGPDPARPELLALILARDEQLALGAVEQEVRVAARKQARRCGSLCACAHDRLIRGEQPLGAEWGADREQLFFERRECRDCGALRDPRPTAEADGARRAEDVEVAPRQLAARVGRVDRFCGHGPDHRRTCTVPADRDRAGRRGVPDRVADAERSRGLAIGHARAVEVRMQLRGDALGAGAALAVRESTQ